MSDKNYYLLELDDLVAALEHKDEDIKELKNKAEKWLDILNEVSCFLEMYVTSEEDKRRIEELDTVIDDVYNLINKGE